MVDEDVRLSRAQDFAAMFDQQSDARKVNRQSPADDLYLFLADLLAPGEVRLSEWEPSEQSTPELRSGKVQLILEGGFAPASKT